MCSSSLFLLGSLSTAVSFWFFVVIASAMVTAHHPNGLLRSLLHHQFLPPLSFLFLMLPPPPLLSDVFSTTYTYVFDHTSGLCGLLSNRIGGEVLLKTAVSYARPASTFVENFLFSVHVLFSVPGFASIFICYLNLGLLSHPLLSLPVAEYNSFFVADSERLEGGHRCLISSARGGIGYGRRHSLVRIGESIRMGFI
ncbi:unnamed protein product [Lactuca saligna]|uniref:Uncharacterized protein n=1 Tax=Lactuca saligna TaxID=75948 RepID=A0AA35UTF5_LACSI|nr:unnamed protein product [Lactuca saligna]